jgi:hypothetical protein
MASTRSSCASSGSSSRNLADHRLGDLPLEEELDDLLGLGADDAVENAAGKCAGLFKSRVLCATQQWQIVLAVPHRPRLNWIS